MLWGGRGPDKNGEIMSVTTRVDQDGAAVAMAHARCAGGRHRQGHHRVKAGILVALAFGVLAAGTTFVLGHAAASQGKAAARSAGPGRAGVPGAGPALRVLWVSPGSSADPVTAANPVRVVFSAPLAVTSPLPAFSPAVAGTWQVAGSAMVFTPAAPLGPVTQVTLQVPAGPSGVRSATGATLAAPVTAVFQAGGWSTLRLEQLLAQLNYLPLTVTPARGSGSGGTTAASYSSGHPAAAAPGGGVLTVQSGYPAALISQWQPGKPGVMLTGALMAFQADEGLPMTGHVTAGLWQALLNAVAQGQRNPNGYGYALVDKAQPETITIWRNGQVVMHGLANTGGSGSPTPDGTFPVYLRRPAQVMRGLAPDGKPYADPVRYVAFFHGNYAVHSMKRPSYGSPQSFGCVELPLGEAQQAYPYLSYGTLVTVTTANPQMQS